MDNLFLLGTVLKLKSSDSLVMIIGYYPIDQNQNKVYRYLGVTYPFGIREKNSMIMLDTCSVEKVIYWGYRDQEGEDHCKELNRVMENGKFLEAFECNTFKN